MLEPLPPSEVQKWLDLGEKIQAIKVWRELSGDSLAEAKSQVEAWLANPPPLQAPEVLPAAVLAHLRNGEKIMAVKVLREATGLSLAAALAQIEERLRSPAPLPPAASAPTAATAPAILRPSPAVQEFLRKNSKIEAIKQLRTETGLGLKEAKELVDVWSASAYEPPPPLPELIPGTVLMALRKGEKLRAVHAWTVQLGGSMAQAQESIDRLLQEDAGLREQYLAGIGLDTVLRVNLQDGLRFASGRLTPAARRCVVWCRVPGAWLQDGKLEDSSLEDVFELLYGASWRRGNSDGSRYEVIEVACEPIARESAAWLQPFDPAREQHWYAHGMADGGMAKVSRERF